VQRMAAARPALLLGGEDRLRPAEVIAGVRERLDVQLRSVLLLAQARSLAYVETETSTVEGDGAVGSDNLALLSQDARSSAEVSAFLVRMHCLRAGLESGCRPHRRAMGVRNLVGEQFDDLVGFVGRGR
jgi:hypothetical protein